MGAKKNPHPNPLPEYMERGPETKNLRWTHFSRSRYSGGGNSVTPVHADFEACAGVPSQHVPAGNVSPFIKRESAPRDEPACIIES
jgi:hypothetical protein